jgi:ppGpp synthetase/RelA/SpoT-type nucleotidyltranferase
VGVEAEKWLATYTANYDVYVEAARLAERTIAETLNGYPIAIHSVTGRAKKPMSAAEKVSRKKYGRPRTQLTDTIGVRVITSYSRGVEDVVRRLRDKYEIDDANSVDKRQSLGLAEVGYRSIHVVLTLGKIGATGEAAELLLRSKVEVQVRSIVDHAWAEIEHELRYKSGVELSREIQRRFAALAGALELVDREFDNLAQELVALVHLYSARYHGREILDDEFDAARYLGFISEFRRDAVKLGPSNIPLSFEQAAECVRALREIDLATGSKLLDVIESQPFRTLIRDYADRRGIEPGEVSGLGIAAAVVLITNPDVLARYGSLSDPVMRQLVEGGTPAPG